MLLHGTNKHVVSCSMSLAYINTHKSGDWSRVVPPIRAHQADNSTKYKKIKNLKYIDRVKPSDYKGVFKGAEFKKWHLLSSKMAFILCAEHSFFVFWPISVRGKLNPANSGGLKFWKYTPLQVSMGGQIIMEKNVKVDQGLGLMMWQYFFLF